MQDYRLWIGSEWVSPASGETFPIYNPTTGEEIAKTKPGRTDTLYSGTGRRSRL